MSVNEPITVEEILSYTAELNLEGPISGWLRPRNFEFRLPHAVLHHLRNQSITGLSHLAGNFLV